MRVPVSTVAYALDGNHYLGHAHRGFAWSDEYGIAVLGGPTSRRLPTDWLELSRWCLRGEKNDGSRQWSRIARELRRETEYTTVVSYSDPSVGHTGALYRACNWWWAPTWHRVVPPPSGFGSWDGMTQQSVKDRWVFALRPDSRRVEILRVEESYVRRFPWSEYREPGGADYKRFCLDYTKGRLPR
jgi:hypothetical protein